MTGREDNAGYGPFPDPAAREAVAMLTELREHAAQRTKALDDGDHGAYHRWTTRIREVLDGMPVDQLRHTVMFLLVAGSR